MISVIVPAYNTEKTIQKTLVALNNQNYLKNNFEIVCVDDGSTDGTKEIIKRFKRVKLIVAEHKGPAAARNLGVKHAKGEILLFTDADCVPSKNWIRNMAEPFRDKEIEGVSGTYKTLNKNSLTARFAGYEINERHKKLRKEKYTDFIGTYSAGYRRKTFLEFGGFDTTFSTASGEDPELSFKMSMKKLKMIFQPKAFVYHKHPDSLWKYLKQKFWRGYWRIFLYRKHPHKMLKHSYTPKSLFVEIAWTEITLLLLVLGIAKLVPLYFGLSSLLILFLITLPFSIRILIKDKITGFLSPPILILRNIFIGLGILYGLLNLIVSNLKK